jgi:tripartite-type tricarboxylate transporter receptor subunit TctC
MNATMTRRRALTMLAAAGAGFGAGPRLLAQPRLASARILCGYPAGGIIDVVARKLAERLSATYAGSVLVDNKPGAAGRLAVEALKGAAPDGSTLLVTPGSVAMMYPHIYRNLAYDVFVDLTPVSIVANSGFALAVGPAVPASVASLEEFLQWCRQDRAKAQCGNPGAGSLPHFMAMILARESRVELTHVPYRGGLLAMQDAAAGQVSAALSTEAAALALARDGKLRVLATTGPLRSPFLPHAPTFRELGYPALTQREWFAVFMPARTPPAVVASAAEAIQSALREPDLRDVWQKGALYAESSSPAELQATLRRDFDFWGPVIRASGFTPEA